ncbi:hypothetical protein [Microbacterium capsulatum]|uniref:Uncharacterized protein n=1 Tax=Microbacterium capsulatum TaxID=3041921 RepID=A0ABU0XMQ7_9MICO|nr:hypothetical protein [Microbacterium sp. ASV81]MDQ4215015.1 hypothetical protein [Microbacterium sp. ASV81]
MRERGRRRSAADEEYRRSSRAIGWQVVTVSAALVVVGAALAIAYVFRQTRPAELARPPDLIQTIRGAGCRLGAPA